MEEDKACIRVYADKQRLQLCAERLGSAGSLIQGLSQVLSLTGSETRLRILYLLEEEGELCVCDLSDVLQMTMPAVSQQLRKLRDGGIIQSKKVGQTIFYSLRQEHMAVIKPLFSHLKSRLEEA